MAITINPSQFLYTGKTGNSRAAAPEKASETLSGALEKALPGVVKATERQSPEETARNILKHVQTGLNQLRAQGADAGRLEERLQAAREGIAKGYAEATDILKGLGMLDDDMQGQIDQGRSLVDQGLEELSLGLQQPQSAYRLSSASASLSVANQLSLQVLTREGDRVTVSFSQSQSSAAAVSSQGFSLMASAQQSWQMEVAGDLSPAETEALSALFNDVQSLSERFFAGDIGSALESAMTLGYDGSQLAALSLNLTQRTTITSTSAYSAVREQLPTPELESLKAPLASYVDSYLQALDKAGALADAPQTFSDLVQSLLPEESRMPVWQSFHDGLNQLLQARNGALSE